MKPILYRLFDYQNLSQEESRQLLHQIVDGKYNSAQISALITVFLMRHISIDELIGFRTALLEMCHRIDFSSYKPIDIVGTGGDGKNTFNISTCACIVVAGAGYPVVKHGNYGASSISGASNVIEQHGVKFTQDPSLLRRTMDACHFVYLHAPLFNPALKAVAEVRKNLAVRSFFNILGPLVNPTLPIYQFLGVYNLALQRLYSYLYQAEGIQFSVVHSLDGFDEISLTDNFKIVTNDYEKIYSPEMIGLEVYKESDLFGGETVEEAAAIFDMILNNTATEVQKNVVLANAAFAMKLICPEKSIAACIDEAHTSLESGKAKKVFDTFVTLNS